jgi:hypothetical protein
MRVDLNGVIAFFCVSVIAVGIVFYDSGRHGILWPSQMRRPGISAMTHGGLWSDLLPLPLVMCFALLHSSEWSIERDWLPVLLGIGIAIANQILLNGSARPDPLGSIDLKWSPGIAIHGVYMATYIAIIGHFFFHPMNVTSNQVVAVSIFLGLHVAAGTHVFLGMAHLIYQWDSCPDPLSDKLLPYMNGAVWLLLAGLTWFAGDMRAGLTVAWSGSLFASAVVAFASLVVSMRK